MGTRANLNIQFHSALDQIKSSNLKYILNAHILFPVCWVWSLRRNNEGLKWQLKLMRRESAFCWYSWFAKWVRQRLWNVVHHFYPWPMPWLSGLHASSRTERPLSMVILYFKNLELFSAKPLNKHLEVNLFSWTKNSNHALWRSISLWVETILTCDG